jgi:hypothetical protein
MGAVGAALLVIVLYFIGVFDTTIRQYILDSFVVQTYVGEFDAAASNHDSNFQSIVKCPAQEKLISGTCIVKRSGGSIQKYDA